MRLIRGTRRTTAVLKWIGAAAAASIAIAVVLYAFCDPDVLKHPLERIASARLGRAVTL
jgi:uncharacterized protein involved in outer membrane biogenesis